MNNPFKRSLAAKIIGLMSVILIGGFGVFAIIDVRQDSDSLIDQKEKNTEILSSSVVNSIENIMLTGKGEIAVRALDNLRNVPQVERIQVFSTGGVEAFSGGNPPGEPSQQVVDVLLTGVGQRFVEERDGTSHMVDIKPLPNEQSCQQCHDAAPVRGAVLVSTSMEDVEAATDAKKVRMGLVFFPGIFVVMALLAGTLLVVVIRPMGNVVSVIRNIAHGDLSRRVEVTSSDEIGDMAQSFNRMADHLKETQDNLRQVNLNLLEANRLKSEFLSVMSHELRTPLNAIIGFSEMLIDQQDGKKSQKDEQYLHNIETSGKHLLRLVNDILEMSRVNSDNMELEKEEVSIPQLMEDIRKLGHPFAAQKQIWLDVNLPDDLPLVSADSAKIKRVLYNLVSNGIKFTHEGGRVTIDARMQGDAVEISVTDTGIGISPEDQEKIFTLFQQIDTTHGRRYGGTGVGLALSQKLIEMHGGRIWVESELGQGSRFTFSIPLQETQHADTRWSGEAQVTEARVAPETVPGQPLVLVVEDDPRTSDLISIWLQDASYRVANAYDGEQALELARKLRPFAITLDILLPKIDGWQVLRQLKADSETKDIPVIIISILEKTSRGKEMGAIDYFVKPVEKKDLLCRLESRSLRDAASVKESDPGETG